ncbi:hypothetical protein FRD01_22775 [Microvenator marinus]|jgi:hypothetical protein|uniref:Uncharacterized protein n=1 Tax=Microvenator marinus TaxID=2600177 RepID=A0A5B8XWN5_9DELT|nr:hypothetical protein [Microvenator marinus]QED30005.1 hypothetical protein FRD01_22775 [Microvenator marinus]
MKTFWFPFLLSTSALIACGDVENSSAKGEEESALIDGKEDSFFRPTQHGDLSFGLENRATVTADEVFHAWEFTLTDASSIELKTVLGTRNLDTVMYLYRRDSSEETWGRYIKKNDDHQGEIWSQIDGEFEAGQYRVIVKPFKTKMTGSFHVAATCEGAGCPGAVGACEPDAGLPAETGYGASCAAPIFEVLSTEVQSSNQFSVSLTEKCNLPSLAQNAVNHYIAYWDEVAGFEELFGYDGEIQLNIETTTFEKGQLIWIDTGGDEDGMNLVYDAQGMLLALHQSNQSPDDRFFCKENQDEELEIPTCFSESLHTFKEVSEDGEFLQGVTSVESVNQGEGFVPEYVALAVKAYARQHGLIDGSIKFISTINTGEYSTGADVEVWDFEGVLPHERFLYADERILMQSGEAGVQYVCER